MVYAEHPKLMLAQLAALGFKQIVALDGALVKLVLIHAPTSGAVEQLGENDTVLPLLLHIFTLPV